MTKMKAFGPVAILSAFILFPVLVRAGAPKEKAEPIPDRTLGLSKTSVFDTPAPPLNHAEDSSPGEKAPPPRISSQIPPVIPHGVADLLPISKDSNACLSCHEVPGPKVKGEPTPIPASHYVDFRSDPNRREEHVAKARYVCISCHVLRTDAKPIVSNRFRP